MVVTHGGIWRSATWQILAALTISYRFIWYGLWWRASLHRHMYNSFKHVRICQSSNLWTALNDANGTCPIPSADSQTMSDSFESKIPRDASSSCPCADKSLLRCGKAGSIVSTVPALGTSRWPAAPIHEMADSGFLPIPLDISPPEGSNLQSSLRRRIDCNSGTAAWSVRAVQKGCGMCTNWMEGAPWGIGAVCGSIFLIFSQPMECDRIPMDAMAMAIWQLVLVQCICFFDLLWHSDLLRSFANISDGPFQWVCVGFVGNHG